MPPTGMNLEFLAATGIAPHQAGRRNGEPTDGVPMGARSRSARCGVFLANDADEAASGDTLRSNDKRMITSMSMSNRRKTTRRAFLKATGSTAAVVAAAKASFIGGAHVAHAAGPEVTKAILGYIALMDASPLVIAKEKGFFAKHGM